MKRLLPLVLALTILTDNAKAQDSTDEKFQHLVKTSGYAAAFGTALGVAALSFQESPSKHLKFVAVGASLGFIGGSILGTYIIFSPVFSQTSHSEDFNSLRDDGYDFKLAGLQGEFVIARF